MSAGPLTVAQATDRLTAPGARYELEDVVVDGRPTRRYRNAPSTLRAIFEASAAFTDREAVVFEQERLTYAELHRQVAALAWTLRADFSVGRGDRVAILMRNLPEFVVTFWAVEALGAIAVPLNGWWSRGELRWGLGDCEPKVLVVDGERLGRLVGPVGEARTDGALAGVALIVTRPEAPLPDGARAWSAALALGARAGGLPSAAIDSDDPATILYTSGTTGRPKGVVTTHRNHCALIMTAGFQSELAALTAVAPPSATSTDQPALLNPMPFFHIGGLSSLYCATAGGVKQVLIRKWDNDEVLRLFRDEQITNLSAVPTMLRRLLEAAQDEDLATLAGLGVGGGPGAGELAEQLAGAIGRDSLVNHGYGLTETTSSAAQHIGASFFARPTSAGPAVPGAAIRIVADGVDVPTGGPGEIWVRGPQVVTHYWRNPEATAESFVDGWFRTGDIGALDEIGYLSVLDREKDVIVRGGENVYSAEVESVILQDPDVAEVAVVGLPDHDLGEIVAAAVVAQANATVTVEELRARTAENIAAFKVPVRWWLRDEPLPRNATQKVLKQVIREAFPG